MFESWRNYWACFDRRVLVYWVFDQANAKTEIFKKKVKHLIIKLDYISNLFEKNYLINDFLFMLCYFKCFFFGDEPFFLSENLQIKIEIQNYSNDFLYEEIPFLKLLPREHLKFDLNRLEVPRNDILHPIQSTCFFIQNTIRNSQTSKYFINPTESKFYNFHPLYPEDTVEAVPLTKDAIIQILQEFYINNAERKGDMTFSKLIFFCKLASQEFRNLNYNTFLNLKLPGGINKNTTFPWKSRILSEFSFKFASVAPTARSMRSKAMSPHS